VHAPQPRNGGSRANFPTDENAQDGYAVDARVWRTALKYASILIALLLAFAALPGRSAAQDQRIIVFAAASLKDALDEVNAAYKQAKGVDVTTSYAGSGALIKQIEQGAPAQVFISADLESMYYGFAKKAVQEKSRVNLLGNRLVLIAAADSKQGGITIGKDTDIATLAGNGRIATGDVKAVPVGRYAQIALDKLGQWKAVEPKLAQVENVRLAMSLVARGEAPLGIVYETDARVEPKVKVIGAFPMDSYPKIIYPAALTTAAKPGAAAYLDFLQSAPARAIFEKRGFTVLAKQS
jgi:molybdate transport system substrate-binding protein